MITRFFMRSRKIWKAESMYPAALAGCHFPVARLIFWYSVPKYYRASDTVALPFTGIAGIAFDGVDGPPIATFYDADVADRAVAFPVEENDIAGSGLVAALLPLVSVLEPLDAVIHPGELRHDTGLDISALVCAPADEAGAP